MTSFSSPPVELELVERELARRLAICVRASVRTSFFGYGLQALLLREIVAPRLLLAWAGAVLVLELLNGYLAGRVLRALDDADRRGFLVSLLPAALFATGGVWGLAAVLPGTETAPWVQALNLLVMAVVALFSVHNLCVRRICLSAFSIGMGLPLLASSFLQLGGFGIELSVTVLALLAMVHIYGRLLGKLIASDVRAQASLESVGAQLQRTREELSLAIEQLDRVASSDPLTRCLNRRAFMEKLEHEQARRTRYGTSFGVILLDLDRLKSVNERFGDDTGDQVLVAAADCLRSQLRPIDSLARWSGGQFLCLIAHVREDDLLSKAEDLRYMLSHSPLVFAPEEITVTASLGAAIFRPELTVLEMIAMADRAMSRAKSNGRNRVLLAA
jgi:diguanylate cyclase (GGDEF)-like protein